MSTTYRYNMADRHTDHQLRYYEYIVVGCGGIGSATVYWLSKRAGKDVLGLEQYKLGHDNGGSQDHSRIIRIAYRHDRLTKLAQETYKAWSEVEEESGMKLVYKTGGLYFARKGEMEHAIDEYVTAMDANNIKFDRLTGTQIRTKFPQFATDDSYVGLYQPEDGVVDAALANSVHIQLARGNGATVIENCPVLRIDKSADGRTLVYTPQGVFQCRRLVVCAGAWINHVLGSIGVHIPVYITQEQVTYIASHKLKEFTKERFPIWNYDSPQYRFYGLPIHGNSGTKIAVDAAGPVVTPETRSFVPDPTREKACFDFLKKFIPKSLGPLLYSKTCLYAMTPDRHFVIDTCAKRGWENVIVCCGAGHAFKFCCLFGKILTEMAVDGGTKYDISSFNIDREALTNPDSKLETFVGSTGGVPPSIASKHSKL